MARDIVDRLTAAVTLKSVPSGVAADITEAVSDIRRLRAALKRQHPAPVPLDEVDPLS